LYNSTRFCTKSRKKLHDSFGMSGNANDISGVMKQLFKIKSEFNKI